MEPQIERGKQKEVTHWNLIFKKPYRLKDEMHLYTAMMEQQ